jgi:hypothetical protein
MNNRQASRQSSARNERQNQTQPCDLIQTKHPEKDRKEESYDADDFNFLGIGVINLLERYRSNRNPIVYDEGKQHGRNECAEIFGESSESLVSTLQPSLAAYETSGAGEDRSENDNRRHVPRRQLIAQGSAVDIVHLSLNSQSANTISIQRRSRSQPTDRRYSQNNYA